MEFRLTQTNIVVLAKNHNPTIVSKEWLIQNKIIEDQILNFSHVPVFSLIETDNFNLVVDPDRLQLSIKKISPANLKTLPQIILKYINQLPETPYTAIGFNYSYNIEIDQKSLKNALLINEKKLIETFSKNYSLGVIVKFLWMGFTMTTTFRPINNREIRGDFNFHFASNKKAAITKKLSEHPKTKKTAEKILEGLFYA